MDYGRAADRPYRIFNGSFNLLHFNWADFIGILLISVGSYFVIQKTLSPVNVITQKANRISKNNLDERIKIHNQEDELGQLSIVLNNLLDRLQTAFESQQQFMADAAHELKTPLSILRSTGKAN